MLPWPDRQQARRRGWSDCRCSGRPAGRPARLVEADAAATANEGAQRVRLVAKPGLAVVRVIGVQREACTTDGQNVGREGGVLGIGGSVVARAGHEGHARGGEIAVVGCLIAGEDALAFGESPAHRFDRDYLVRQVIWFVLAKKLHLQLD